MNEQNVLEKIEIIIGALSKPLTCLEEADGWTAESKKANEAFFIALKNKMISGEILPPMSISRALDSWCVCGGPILEMAAQISNEIRARSMQ